MRSQSTVNRAACSQGPAHDDSLSHGLASSPRHSITPLSDDTSAAQVTTDGLHDTTHSIPVLPSAIHCSERDGAESEHSATAIVDADASPLPSPSAADTVTAFGSIPVVDMPSPTAPKHEDPSEPRAAICTPSNAMRPPSSLLLSTPAIHSISSPRRSVLRDDVQLQEFTNPQTTTLCASAEYSISLNCADEPVPESQHKNWQIDRTGTHAEPTPSSHSSTIITDIGVRVSRDFLFYATLT